MASALGRALNEVEDELCEALLECVRRIIPFDEDNRLESINWKYYDNQHPVCATSF